MTWSNASSELRTLLSDGPTDKLRHLKFAIGIINGANKNFKTFEYRRITNLKTEASAFLGVFVNNTKVTLSSDDPSTGDFVLTAAPADGYDVLCSYYYQWFLDSELDTFLQNGADWLGLGTTLQVPPGLHAAVMKYAAHDAFQKLSLRFSESLSAVYRTEDAPDQSLESMVGTYKKLADNLYDEAVKLRDDYYKRQGRALQPLWGFVRGTVRKTEPNR